MKMPEAGQSPEQDNEDTGFDGVNDEAGTPTTPPPEVSTEGAGDKGMPAEKSVEKPVGSETGTESKPAGSATPVKEGDAKTGAEVVEPETAQGKLEKLASIVEEVVGEAARKGADTDAEFFTELEQYHPDARQLSVDPNVIAWIAKQDAVTQALAKNGGPLGAAKVLTDYKAVLQAERDALSNSSKQTSEQIAESVFGQKIKTEDGKEITVAEAIESVGVNDFSTALKSAFQVLAGKIAELGSIRKESQPPSNQPERETDGEMESRVTKLAFWSDVAVEHPDCRKIWQSSPFAEFWKTQPETVRNRFKNGMTDPVQAIAILDAYKEHQAKAQTDKDNSVIGERHRKSSELLKGSLRQGSSGGGAKGKAKDDDEDAGFAEGNAIMGVT